LAALEASVARLHEIGVVAIFDHVTRYLDELEAGLLARGFKSLRAPEMGRRSGILAVRSPERVAATTLHAAIMRRKVPCSVPDGLVRFAPHGPNHPSEVPRVLETIDASIAEALTG